MNKSYQFLSSPAITIKSGEEKMLRLVCNCGNLQCHNLQKCNDCGSEFKLDPTKISLYQIIIMKATHNPHYTIERSLNYFYSLFQWSLNGETLRDWVDEFNKLKE